MTAQQDFESIAQLCDHSLAQDRSVPRIVEAILATYDVDGLRRPKLTTQDQPDEGIRLVTDALEVSLQQIDEFLVALKPAHRDLPPARPAPNPG